MVSCVSKPAIYDVTPIYLIASGCNVIHGIQCLRLLLLLSLLTLSTQLVVVLRTYVDPRQHLLRDYQISVEESQLLSISTWPIEPVNARINTPWTKQFIMET